MSAESSDAGGQARWVLLEILVSLATSIAFVYSCTSIHVDPIARTGQVSMLAAIAFRVLTFGFAIVGALVLASRLRGGRYWPRVSAFACAALAGIASAAVAGGIVAILHRTHFALGAFLGDSAALADWADKLNTGIESPDKGILLYPPMQIHLISWISKLFDLDPLYAVKHFQILGIVLVGPCCYGAWRLLLRPAWALGLGVVCALPLVEAYRAYPMLVLLMFLPVMVKYLDTLRESADRHGYELAKLGVVYGIGFGLMFLMYSGWIRWSAPGIFVAGLIYFPWRTRPSHGAIFVGVTIFAFAIVSFNYLVDLSHAPPIKDDYMYFDATIEPSYIAMWRGGMPGNVPVWPPTGELGGVGLFTAIMVAGTGVAIWLGSKRTLVVSIALMLAGTWLWRMWLAHYMYQTKLVQLYPRTVAELLYGGLILTGYAIYLAVEHARARSGPESAWFKPSATIGSCSALVILFMSSSSATIDRYNAINKGDYFGYMAWEALHTPPLEGDQAIDAKATYSEPANQADAEGWIELRLPSVRAFQAVKLTPAEAGFPIDFDLEVWDGLGWVNRGHFTNVAAPSATITLRWEPLDYTSAFRLHATKLRAVGDGYAVRMKKIELTR